MALFAGKHCVIVGATGTIGSAIAKAFSNQGAVCTLLGRTATKVRPALEEQLTPYQPPSSTENGPDLPPSHQFVDLDVSQPGAIKGAFTKQQQQSQSPAWVRPSDILVNCAGISQTTLLKRTPDEEIEKILNTNLLATMLVCKYAQIRPNGCIINVSSLMANKGAIGASVYAASKAGLLGFNRALCQEMAARSIRVNLLLPGWVESSMWNNLKEDLKSKYLQQIALHRVGDPSEIANGAVFLASNQYANNCVLNLDGGLSAT